MYLKLIYINVLPLFKLLIKFRGKVYFKVYVNMLQMFHFRVLDGSTSKSRSVTRV